MKTFHYTLSLCFIYIYLACGRLTDYTEQQQPRDDFTSWNNAETQHDENLFIKEESRHRDLTSSVEYQETVCYDLAGKHICLGTVQLPAGTSDVIDVTTQTSRFDRNNIRSSATCRAQVNQQQCNSCRTCGDDGTMMSMDCSNVLPRNSRCARIDCDGTCHRGSHNHISMSELVAFKRAMLASGMVCLILIAVIHWIFQTCCKQYHGMSSLVDTNSDTMGESYAGPPSADRQELIDTSLIRKSMDLDNPRIRETDETNDSLDAAFGDDPSENDDLEPTVAERSTLPAFVNKGSYDVLPTRDDEEGRKSNSRDDSSIETDIDTSRTILYVDDEEEVCHVCLEPLCCGQDVAESKVSNCRHLFHYECISAWLQRHEDCPCCRASFLLDNSSDESQGGQQQ